MLCIVLSKAWGARKGVHPTAIPHCCYTAQPHHNPGIDQSEKVDRRQQGCTQFATGAWSDKINLSRSDAWVHSDTGQFEGECWWQAGEFEARPKMPYTPGTPKVLRMQHVKGCYYSSSGSAFNNPTPRTKPDNGFVGDFFWIWHQNQRSQSKNEQAELHQTKSFYIVKETVNRTKRLPTEWGKGFANCITD